MLNSEEKKYSNSCVVRIKNSERNKKPYPPPFKLNGRSLSQNKFCYVRAVYNRDNIWKEIRLSDYYVS
jgi:hypothetical protein